MSAPARCSASPAAPSITSTTRDDVDAKALAIVTPGVLGPDYFREIGAIVDAAAGGPPDLAALGAVMRRHGLRLVSVSVSSLKVAGPLRLRAVRFLRRRRPAKEG